MRLYPTIGLIERGTSNHTTFHLSKRCNHLTMRHKQNKPNYSGYHRTTNGVDRQHLQRKFFLQPLSPYQFQKLVNPRFHPCDTWKKNQYYCQYSIFTFDKS